jgi:cobalt-zinc-cadmium efflux system protein
VKKRSSVERLTLAFVLNLIFTVIEFVGGLITNSVALLSDAIHDFGDAFTIGLAVFFERKATRKPDQEFTYGYRRYSLLGALIAAFGLVIGVIFIVIESVKRLINPEAIRVELLIYFAIGGILVNGFAAWQTQKGKSLSEQTVGLHLWEDVIGWALLLVAAILMHFTQVLILDAILSMGFSLYILYHVFRHLKRIIDVFMEKAPTDPSLAKLKSTLKETPGVFDIHHIHYWTLEGERKLFTAHVVTKKNLNQPATDSLQKILHDKLSQLGIYHATLEFESEQLCASSKECIDNLDQ